MSAPDQAQVASPDLHPLPPVEARDGADDPGPHRSGHATIQGWFAIHRERLVDRWLAEIGPYCLAETDPAFVRLRLDGYYRAIATSALTATPTPYIDRSIGIGLARMTGGSDDGLHSIRTGLADLVTDGLTQPLRERIDDRLQRIVTRIVAGYCRHPLVADPAPAAPASGHFPRLDRYLASHPGWVMVEDLASGAVILDNDGSLAMLGYTAHEMATLPDTALMGPETPEDDYDKGVELIAGTIPLVERMTSLRHRDGRMVPLAVRIWTIRDGDGLATHLVTEFTLVPVPIGAAHWQQADKRYRHLAQLSGDALMIVAADGTVRYASPSTERCFGLDPDALTGSSFATLAVEEDRATLGAFIADVAAAAPRGTRETVVRLRRADELWRWFEVTGTNLLDVPDFAGISVQARDITDRRHLEEILNQQAVLDPLTGLLNRRGIIDLVAAEIGHYEATGARAAVLFMDLDYFKQINDGHGHEMGDRVLSETARRMGQLIGATTSIGRLGGDEFIVLLRDTSHTGAMQVARQIIAAMAAPFDVDGVTVRTGASVGIALTERPGQNVRSLFRTADVALYRAKDSRDGNPVMGFDRGE